MILDSTMVQTKYSDMQTLEFGYNMGQSVQDASEPATGPSGFQSVMLPNIPILLPNSEEGVVLAGFQDCSEEAIRYLIDVEHMDEEDPLIVGLKQHLWQHQQQMDIAQTFAECLQSDDRDATSDSSDEEESVRTECDSNRIPPLAPPHSGLPQGAASPSSDTDMSEDMEHSVNSGTQESEAMPAHMIPGSHHIDSASEQRHHEHMSESVLDLALLAQNNPAIATLTEEILQLLQADSHTDQQTLNNPQSLHS